MFWKLATALAVALLAAGQAMAAEIRLNQVAGNCAPYFVASPVSLGDVPVSIHNGSQAPMTVAWVDFSGVGQILGMVSPGQTFSDISRPGHRYVVFDGAWNCLGGLVAAAPATHLALQSAAAPPAPTAPSAPRRHGGSIRAGEMLSLSEVGPNCPAFVRPSPQVDASQANAKVPMTFNNFSTQPVMVAWIDPRGGLTFFGRLDPQNTFTDQTWYGQNFVVTDMALNCLKGQSVEFFGSTLQIP